MTKEAKAARNEYYREYRAKNKERVRRITEDYWERSAQKRREAEHGKTES